jgi:hypothetical protein
LGDREPLRPPPSPYSDQYETIVAQGHARPTPAFGAPTLVWHVAIWPRRTLQGVNGAPELCDPHDTAGARHDKAKEVFVARRKAWLEQLNRFLQDLQARSYRKAGSPKQLRLVEPHDLPWTRSPADPGDFFRPIEVPQQEIVPFTLWWEEPDSTSPEVSAIRVCVHPEVNADFACISFYMDVSQRWNAAAVAGVDPAQGGRRALLMSAVDDIRRICDAQLEPVLPDRAASVDLPALPEVLRSPDQRTPEQLHDALKAHRNLLYVDVWEAFSKEMRCRLDDIAGDRGEVFANFRGLIMSTGGLPEAGSGYVPSGAATASVGTAPFASFSADPRFMADGVEANAVVKAYWPLVRRITPRADFRELVACGVLDWRAIYITALGSPSQYAAHQEREPSHAEEGEASIRVPSHLLPDDEKLLASVSGPFDSQVRKRAGSRPGNNHPVRYLLLTKHAPHPRQIGRIAERINAMGTMRLYALKDWAAVRNADPYLRIFGQELDQITKQWSRDRRLINSLTSLKVVQRAAREVKRLDRVLAHARDEADEQRLINGFEAREEWRPEEVARLRIGLPSFIPGSPAPWIVRLLLLLRYFYNWRRYGELLRSMENDLVADIRHAALYEISNRVETDLIDISAKLDELGFGAVGGLHFRLNRSAYYVGEFHTLLDTLRVGNIPTWISYEQFVRRGLEPTFDFMKGVGERLRAVRARLLTITETIETSALVGQSAATRHNTAVLRRATALGVVILLLLAAYSSDEVRDLVGRARGLGARLIAAAYAWLPGWMTAWIEQAATWLQSLLH